MMKVIKFAEAISVSLKRLVFISQTKYQRNYLFPVRHMA